MIDFDKVDAILRSRFGGYIRKGSHSEDGKGCLIEIANAAIGAAWSDDPTLWPDFRSINDAFSSDEARTRHLWPVLRAYWHWSEWSTERQRQIIERVVILTVQRIIADLPGLPAEVAQRCREATTREAAWAAAWAAGPAGAAWAAAWAAERAAELAAWEAAWEAAWASWAAAGAARVAAADSVLERACALWIEALEVQP